MKMCLEFMKPKPYFDQCANPDDFCNSVRIDVVCAVAVGWRSTFLCVERGSYGWGHYDFKIRYYQG